jgi:hypothetical protein
MPSTPLSRFDASSFSIFRRSMMQTDDLPLSDAIDDARFREVLEKHGVDFGADPDAVYTPAITLWALISQVLFTGEQRSCKAAVARVASLWATLGRRVCDSNTGAYCRARARISFAVIREIVQRLTADAEAALSVGGSKLEEQAPKVVADIKSIPTNGRILLVDGFTITAADTAENQAEFPQNPAQAKGLGFPILRCVSLISLTTGLLVDLAAGPYSGKESGETALLWQLLESLRPGDTLVADSYYCTYWLIGACHARGVHIVMKNHHKRDDHPKDARPLSKRERLVTWHRPQQPTWMSEEDYVRQPTCIDIRLVDVRVDQKGFRTKAFTVATTITDRKTFTADWIASVYRGRWLIELDIRSIKASLGMEILRAKTPEMLRTELWSCLLAYNLIRIKMLQSCAPNDRDPRSVSFATTQQLLATNWLLCAVIGVTTELSQLGQEIPCSERVGHRYGRVEPRANKRRPKVLALLNKPRKVYQAEITAAA